jgi:hypothetical protein
MRIVPMNEIEFIVEVLPEEAPVRGNAMASGDDDFDRKVEDEIFASLMHGNEWAWCKVEVTACVDGIEGTDYLGCCNYDSEEDFRKGSEWEQMKEQAAWELRGKLADAKDAVDRALMEFSRAREG